MSHEEYEHKPDQEDHEHHTKRDAESNIAIGSFLSVISIPVLIGTFYADQAFSRGVNVAAGLVLLGIGGTMVAFGLKYFKEQ